MGEGVVGGTRLAMRGSSGKGYKIVNVANMQQKAVSRVRLCFTASRFVLLCGKANSATAPKERFSTCSAFLASAQSFAKQVWKIDPMGGSCCMCHGYAIMHQGTKNDSTVAKNLYLAAARSFTASAAAAKSYVTATIRQAASKTVRHKQDSLAACST